MKSMIIKPQISVIVPVYKVEAYLHRCVDSILAQTFTDFELILVDDGSPDNCGKICDEYAAKDKRIHAIHQENGGLSAARNAGIDWAFANSDSQWLSFIDSDDWVHPCFLEYLYRAVQETGCKVSACSFVRVEGQEEYPEIPFSEAVENWEQFYIEDWGRGVVACCKLYAKELFSCLRYPVGRIHEDEFLTYKILDRAKEVAVLDANLYYYYQNPGGIIKGGFSLRKLDGVNALREQSRYARKKGYTDLYLECQKRRLRCSVKAFKALEKTETLSTAEKKKITQGLRTAMREVLLVSGKDIAPRRLNRWYYELAFPKVTWLYWSFVGIKSRIKRMVYKNARD